MNTSLQLYRHARKDLGISEVAGSKSHPRIQFAINLAASWLNKDDSKTAWCGCMMGLWCIELGLSVPKESFRAISWLNWGVAVEPGDEQQGDVVVMKRAGGNHVTLFEDVISNTRWACLGGNQSNQVNSSLYSKATVLGVRRAA